MVKKVLLPMLALVTGVAGASGEAQASKGLGPGDQIVRDYTRATGFRQWTEALTIRSIPGDYAYLEQAYKVYSGLTKNDALPKLNFEKDTFQIRDGITTVTLQYFMGQPSTFAVNGQKVEFNKYDLASVKKKKILQAMKKNTQVSHFLLLPVAWAQGAGTPTKLAVGTFALISATQASESPVTAPHLAELMENAKDTSAWRNFNSKNNACVQKIHAVEDVVSAQEKLDFTSMECSDSGLKIHLAGSDDRGYFRDMTVEKDGFTIEQQPGKNALISRYRLTHPDTLTKGYGLDVSVAQSSSPAQREMMGGEFTPVADSSVEMMGRYMGVATPEVRGFCASSCAGTLKTYWNLLQASASKGSSGAPAKGSR
jgi:hypothetical protein